MLCPFRGRPQTGVGGGELEWDDLFEFQPDQSGGQSGATAAAAGEVVYETVEERFNHAVQVGWLPGTTGAVALWLFGSLALWLCGGGGWL